MRRLALSFLFIGLWLSTAAMAMSPQGSCDYPSSGTVMGLVPTPIGGLYTSSPTYLGSQTIEVHAHWPEWQPIHGQMRYDLVRLDQDDLDLAALPAVASVTVAAQPSYSLPIGSFIDYSASGLTLHGQSDFTIEGWIHPTHVMPAMPAGSGADPAVFGDTICIAGQLRGGVSTSGVGIGLLSPTTSQPARLFAFVRTASSSYTLVMNATYDLTVGDWHYVALTYHSGGAMTFTAANRDGRNRTTVSRTVTGAVVAEPAVSGGFRLGARLDAPGDRTGCFSGKLDQWTVWDTALTPEQLNRSINDAVGTTVLSPSSDLPPLTDRMMASDFEDVFTPGQGYVVNGHGYNGAVVNHGTPCVPGVNSEFRAIRLNHDQIVDARFPIVASFSPAPTWPSGLYCVRAVFLGTTPTCMQPARLLACFTVRPPTTASTSPRIAVILPTLTWMAYNPWPGVMGEQWEHVVGPRSVVTYYTAEGITPRLRTSATSSTLLPYSQGSNTVYANLGDGVSTVNFASWNRPNLETSPLWRTLAGGPLNGLTINPFGAPVNFALIKWLRRNYRNRFDVLTDFDMHMGVVNRSIYSAVILGGHPEYWSEAMLDHLCRKQHDGGSTLINFGGNTITWRAEPRLLAANPAAQASRSNWLCEIRKWPYAAEHGPTGGLAWFASTASATEYSGAWPFLEQLERTSPSTAANPVGYRHLILGTENDIVGGFDRLDPNFLSTDAAGLFGVWKATMPTHPLWNGTVPANNLTTMRLIGNEADRALVSVSPNNVPFMVPGTYQTLAEGRHFRDDRRTDPVDHVFIMINYDHPVYDLVPTGDRSLDKSTLENSFVPPLTRHSNDVSEPHASIVVYQHTGGGLVLSVPSLTSCLGLSGVSSTAVEPSIEALIRSGLASAGF